MKVQSRTKVGLQKRTLLALGVEMRVVDASETIDRMLATLKSK